MNDRTRRTDLVIRFVLSALSKPFCITMVSIKNSFGRMPVLFKKADMLREYQ